MRPAGPGSQIVGEQPEGGVGGERSHDPQAPVGGEHVGGLEGRCEGDVHGVGEPYPGTPTASAYPRITAMATSVLLVLQAR